MTEKPRRKDIEYYCKTSDSDVSFISLTKDLVHQQNLSSRLIIFCDYSRDFYHANSFIPVQYFILSIIMRAANSGKKEKYNEN